MYNVIPCTYMYNVHCMYVHVHMYIVCMYMYMYTSGTCSRLTRSPRAFSSNFSLHEGDKSLQRDSVCVCVLECVCVCVGMCVCVCVCVCVCASETKEYVRALCILRRAKLTQKSSAVLDTLLSDSGYQSSSHRLHSTDRKS